jgi:hypothetical protein
LWLNPDSIRGFEGLRAKFAGGIGCVILLSIGSVGDGRAQGTVPAPAAAADADTIPPATISDFGSAGTATGHVSVYPPNRRYPESAAAASGTVSWQWYDPRDGTLASSGTIAGGASQSFTIPGSGDYVLWISK